MSPAYDVMEMLPLMIGCLSLCCFTCEVCIMPDFQPNQYLFDRHADKGSERWEVYAWALRDVMAKTAGFKTTDVPQRTKLEYEYYLRGLPEAKHPSETWT